MREGHFELLDPLRGFAAITVLVYHVIEITDWKDFPTGYGLEWFRWGWMGVDIFFVLSGFVITLSALNIMAREENFGSALKNYALRRLARIAPLHYLAICLYIFLFSDLISQPDFWRNLLTHLLFIHNLIPEYHRAINPPNWTSAVEMQFYGFLIFIIPVLKRKTLIYFVIAGFALAFAWRAWSFYSVPPSTENFLDRVFMKATQLPGMIDFFACGMFMAFFVRSPLFTAIKKRFWFRALLLAGMLLLWNIAFPLFKAHQHTYWYNAWTVIWPRSLLAITFSLLILFLCTFNFSPLCRKLFAPLIYIGAISYGIYLIHWPVLLTIKAKNLEPVQTLALTMGITLLLAAISWHFYERPILRRVPGKGNV